MDLLHSLLNRRSVRQYTDQSISDKCLQNILFAGLSSASSRARRPWELIVVRDKQMLLQMADCRVGSARMLAGADCAIAVVGDAEKSDVWIEDCAIVMANMHLMAAHLGIGSCWIQGRLREATNGQITDDYLRVRLHYPNTHKLLAILSLGMTDRQPLPHTIDELPTDKIHYETY